MQKPSTGKDASTRHDNDQLKVIEQLKKRNAQLDFQMRQLQVLCVTIGLNYWGTMRDYWVKLLGCWGWALAQTIQALHCASTHVQFFLVVLQVFQVHVHGAIQYIQVLADISAHATRPVAPF